MAVRFNKLIRPGWSDMSSGVLAERVVIAKSIDETMVFMSHKTGDRQAEAEANYISNKHKVQVYMAEWDDSVHGDSTQLPSDIMRAIRKCGAFLVNVIAEIAVSMWIGYEIGGAHAMEKTRAKIRYNQVGRLPSVVGALESLRSRSELDQWIIEHVK